MPTKLNLEKAWYSFTKKDWHFIFLNGNDITFYSNDAEIVKQAEVVTEKLKKEDKPNPHESNGGIGPKQLQWLEKELQQAEIKNLEVAIFCHHPLLPQIFAL